MTTTTATLTMKMTTSSAALSMTMMMSLLRPESAPLARTSTHYSWWRQSAKREELNAKPCYNVPMKILFDATRLELSPRGSPWQHFDAAACNLCDTCSAIDQLRAAGYSSYYSSFYSLALLPFIRNLLATYELLFCFSEFHQKLSVSISARELWHCGHALII